jgi:hypothetical protein
VISALSNRITKNSDPFNGTLTAAAALATSAENATSGIAQKLQEELAAQVTITTSRGLSDLFLSDRERAIMSRRSKIGESQTDTVTDPAVLVVRKISLKPDGTLDSFRRMGILENSLQPNAVLASGGDILFATDKFLLQQVTESDEEKIGPTYTFGQVKLFCGGRNPKMYSYGGHLVDNSIEGSAKAQWMDAYDRHLRGSKCARNNAFVELYYRDQIRRGYLLHTNLTESSQQPNRAQFAFSMHVIAEGSTAVEQLVPLIPEAVDVG